MRTVDDRKAAAIIRDAALELFARRGVSDATVREIAAAAGVSPALVIHHYGSKDGLKAAVDRRAVELVEAMIDDLAGAEDGAGAPTLAELFARRLEVEPALIPYVRRLLVDGGPAAEALFRRLFETCLAGLGSLEAAGVLRAADDPRTRAAFLLANDLAVVLLREQIARVLGADPLTGEGAGRWTAELLDVYGNGLFAVPTGPRDEPSPGEPTR